MDVLRVPAKAMEGVKQTFAIDFGGSVVKLVYIKKNDVHPEGFVLVHRKIFAREQFDEALDFIKKECELPEAEGEELPEYNLTGFGTHQFTKLLTEQLKIRVKTAWEMGCFNEAFRLLINNLPDEELFHPKQFDDEETVKEITEKFEKMAPEWGMEFSENKGEAKNVEEGSDAGAKWPCVMGMLGSAFAFMKIAEDGKATHGGDCNAGGRMFLGLGSLLTGAKTYEELMELAEKGDDRNAHSYTTQLMKSDQENQDNIYESFNSIDWLAFPFGWCVGKPLSDFKKEDLARALLIYVCRDIVMAALVACDKLKVTKTIIVGGFAQSPLTRRILEEEFAKNAPMLAIMNNSAPYTLQVMKAGSHLGALGAMLESKPKPEGQPEATAK